MHFIWKIVKKLLSFVLGLVILGAITTLGSIFILRGLLSGATIIDMAFDVSDVGGASVNEVVSSLTGEKFNYDLHEYVNEEELKENLEDYITDVFKYYGGVIEGYPSIGLLKEQFLEASRKYEEKTGKVVDYEMLDESFDELDEKIAKNVGMSKSENDDLRKVFAFVYSDKIVTVVVVILFLSILIKFLIDRSILGLIKSIVVIAILNSLGNLGFGVALKTIFGENANVSIDSVLANLIRSFNKIAFLSAVVAVIFIVIGIALKLVLRNKNSKVEEVQEEKTFRGETLLSNPYLEENLLGENLENNDMNTNSAFEDKEKN